jgi:hypothetical protein
MLPTLWFADSLPQVRVSVADFSSSSSSGVSLSRRWCVVRQVLALEMFQALVSSAMARPWTWTHTQI